MTTASRTILLGVMALSGAAVAGAVDEPVELDGKHFESFHACNWSNEALERIMKRYPPLKKMDSAWVFRATGEVMGLPVTELYIGVCSVEGNRDCGPANGMSVIVDVPLKQAKAALKARYKTDFTRAKRLADSDSGEDLPARPLLLLTDDKRTALNCF